MPHKSRSPTAVRLRSSDAIDGCWAPAFALRCERPRLTRASDLRERTLDEAHLVLARLVVGIDLCGLRIRVAHPVLNRP